MICFVLFLTYIKNNRNLYLNQQNIFNKTEIQEIHFGQPTNYDNNIIDLFILFKNAHSSF